MKWSYTYPKMLLFMLLCFVRELMFHLMLGACNDNEMDTQKFLEFPKYHKNASADDWMKCCA